MTESGPVQQRKLKIGYAEFYITNVCNLSCPGCNRFNNYRFRGTQRWQDYANDYRAWAQDLDIGHIGILGGEPLLNPDALDWIAGIHSLWPKQLCKIVTNGFHLPRVKGLYDFLAAHLSVKIWLGIHNKMHKPEVMTILKNFLQAPLQFEFHDEHKYRQWMTVVDRNGVEVKVEHNWWFHQGSLLRNEQGFYLHNSDPHKAHENCHMRHCHHFIRGELYKCGVVALLPEFDQQYSINMDTNDRDLMHSYSPLKATDDFDTKSRFISDLPNMIAQCKFCPETYHGDKIFAQKKKDMIMSWK